MKVGRVHNIGENQREPLRSNQFNTKMKTKKKTKGGYINQLAVNEQNRLYELKYGKRNKPSKRAVKQLIATPVNCN